MRYTLTMAASRLGLEPRQLRRCLHIARITPAINPHDAREMLVSEEDMERLQAVARELWPDATARTSDLAARITELERRVNALEARQHIPALAPVPREPPREPIPVALPAPRPQLVEVRTVGPAPEAETATTIAAWLSHHGIAFNTSRQWRDMPLDRAGALRYAVAHKAAVGYRAAYAIHLCVDAACVCRDMLAESGT